MNAPLILGIGTFALLTIEAIKIIVRKIKKDPEYALPVIFYDLGVPFFTAAWGLLFSYVPELGFPMLPPEQLVSLQGLFHWALAIVVELLIYFGGVKPYKDNR